MKTMKMKKILYSVSALAFAAATVLTLPGMASAATFSFAPISGTYAPGETFGVTVFVSPSAGEKITTAKLSLDFPADRLSAVSFTPAAGWIALPVPGADLTDNTNGKLIKTAGFPAKVDAMKQFGLIVFKAKTAGVAAIKANGDSMILDTANANKYVSSAGASFLIVAPAPKPKPKVTPKPKPKTDNFVPKTKTTPKSETEQVFVAATSSATTTVSTTNETGNEQPTPQRNFLFAGIGSILMLGTGSKWLGILIGLLILAAIAFLAKSFTKKKN